MVAKGQQIVLVIVLLAGHPAIPTVTTAKETETTTTAQSSSVTSTTVATSASSATATSKPTDAVLLAVQGLKVSDESTTGVTLTWAKPAGDGHVYTVSYERAGGPTQSNSTEEESFVFSGLLPGYNYTFTVTYVVGNKPDVSPAAWITFVLAPEKPKNITVVPHTTGLTLTWEKPVSKVDQYTVRLNGTLKGNTSTEKLEVLGLNSGTMYKIAVIAISDGKASQEEVVHEATRPEQVIETLKAFKSDTSSVFLRIYFKTKEKTPGSLISVHYTQGKLHPTHIQHFSMPSSGDKIEANVINLSPGTGYSFTGYTELHGVESEPLTDDDSAFADFYTQFAAPQNITVNETTRGTTKVGITWDPFGGFTEFVLYCNHTLEVTVKMSSGECNDLTPGTVFTAHVVTNGVDNGEPASSAPSEILTSITVPLPPKTFTASATGSTSIQLTWTRDKGGLTKWVLMMDPAEGSKELPLSLENTSTTHVIDGLTPGRWYNFSLVAQSVDPVTNEIFDSSVVFVNETTYPGVPENMRILDTSESSLEVAWAAPDGDVSYYNVSVCPSDGSSPCKAPVSVNGTSANLTDLTPAGLKWTVKVTAVSGGLESQSSLDLDAFTFPLQLLSLTIDAVSTISATLTWQHDPGDKAEALLLRWQPQSSTGAMNFSSTNGSEVITGLTPGQIYTFFMMAKSGQWNSTEINNTTTMVPVSPTNLVATNTTSNLLAVSWNITEGIYDSFTARIDPEPKNGSAKIDTKTTNAEFVNLLPGKEYNISIVTKAGDRESATAWKSFNTSEIEPGPPRNLTVEPVNGRSITVKWEEPLEKNGWIERYVLSVAPSSGEPFSLNTSKNETADRRKTIEGLTPVTEYTVLVTAVNGAGAGQTSENITVTTGEAVSGVVSNLTVSKDTAFSMNVSWGHPLLPHGIILHYVLEVSLLIGEAKCQQVVLFNCSDCPALSETDAVLMNLKTRCYPDNKFSVNRVPYQDKASVTYKVTSLMPFTEYNFTVYPVSRPGLGNGTSATETTEEYYPGMVNNIKFTDITSTAFMVSWSAPQKPNGNITKYNISTMDISPGDTEFFSSMDTEKVIENRKMFRAYNVKVRAYTKIGPGNWSEEQHVTTAEDAPTEVRNLTVEVRSSSSLALSWKEPAELNGILRNYDIVYTYNNGTEDITDTTEVSNETTNHILSGMKKWTVYNVSVAAVTVNPGPFKFIVERTDQDVPDGPPKVVKVVNETSTSFNVSWQRPETPNGFITKYSVEYNDTDIKRSKETTDNSTSLVIDGLQSYKLYAISVCANTSKGQGPCSEAKTWRTDQDRPSPPQGVVVTGTNSTFFLIRWDSPGTPNGVILEYEVIATMLPDGSETKNTTTDERQTRIDGLTPYSNYRIKVRAKTIKGYGPWSDAIVERTSEDRPSAVRNCQAVAHSSTDIGLTWLEPETLNGVIRNYIIRYNNQTAAVSGDRMAKNLTGLDKWTDYLIYISAVTTLQGSEAECSPFPIRTLEDVPDEPDLATDDVQPYSLVLKWSVPRPNGVITQHTIEYGIKPNFDSTVSVNGTSTSIRIESLLPCRDYNFKVAAHTKVGRGNFSKVFTVQTSANTPSKPYNLDLKPLTSTSLKLTWIKPNETCPAVYTVRVYRDNRHGEEQLLEKKPEYEIHDNGSLSLPRASSVIITNLDIYTLYSVEIEVVIDGKKNVSERTAKVRTKEDLAGPVAEFTIKVCEECYTRVTAEWKPPAKKNGEITFYIITWKAEGFDKEYNKSISAESTSVTITENIWSETKYTFTIQAQNGAGFGDKKSARNVQTKSGPAVPAITDSAVMTRTIVKDTTEVPVNKWQQFAINLEEQLFDMRNGEVTEIGVFVATSKEGNKIPKELKIAETRYAFPGWRDTLDANGNPKGTYYMIKPMEKPPISWKKGDPLRKRRAVASNIVIVGENTGGCPSGNGEQKYCNAPLQPETDYCVAVGGYTKWGFTRTPCAEFRTGAVPFPLIAVIAGVAFALLVVIIIIIIVVIVRRKRQKRGDDLGPSDGEMIELGTRLKGEDNAAFVITDEYGDEVTVEKPSPIYVRSFPAIVSQMHHHEDKLFKWQYKLLEKVSPVNKIERAIQNEAIKAKNRYINILPFDHTLVPLNIPEGEESRPAAGYTNASYIPGNNHRKEYIACQGPMPRTIDDFWQMVWEQNVSTIVMLTKCIESGKDKCAQYWPPDQNPVFRGDLQVQLQSESFMEDYAIRMVELSDLQSEKSRKVMQFHFLSWPDWGTPDSAYFLLNFVDVVKNHRRTSDTGPKLVHCSAGIGRTGTYITVERLLEQIARQPKISVFDTILDLRESRKGMVQGAKQYTYIHECLKDAIEQRLAKKQVHNLPEKISSQNGNMKC